MYHEQFFSCVSSTLGHFKFDKRNGNCFDINLDPCFGVLPNRVDIDELINTYQVILDQYDILDIGYWSDDEIYEPPCLDWRFERNRLKQDDELVDFWNEIYESSLITGC